MSEPLKYKVEKAVGGFISTASLSALSAWNFYEGQNPGQQSPPCVIAYCASEREAFADGLPKNCGITMEIVSPIDTDQGANSIHGEAADRSANWSAHRAAVQAIEAKLQDLTGLKAYANKVNVTNRPVSAFYIYDIHEEGQSSNIAAEQRMIVSTITLTVVCEAQDN